MLESIRSQDFSGADRFMKMLSKVRNASPSSYLSEVELLDPLLSVKLLNLMIDHHTGLGNKELVMGYSYELEVVEAYLRAQQSKTALSPTPPIIIDSDPEDTFQLDSRTSFRGPVTIDGAGTHKPLIKKESLDVGLNSPLHISITSPSINTIPSVIGPPVVKDSKARSLSSCSSRSKPIGNLSMFLSKKRPAPASCTDPLTISDGQKLSYPLEYKKNSSPLLAPNKTLLDNAATATCSSAFTEGFFKPNFTSYALPSEGRDPWFQKSVALEDELVIEAYPPIISSYDSALAFKVGVRSLDNTTLKLIQLCTRHAGTFVAPSGDLSTINVGEALELAGHIPSSDEFNSLYRQLNDNITRLSDLSVRWRQSGHDSFTVVNAVLTNLCQGLKESFMVLPFPTKYDHDFIFGTFYTKPRFEGIVATSSKVKSGVVKTPSLVGVDTDIEATKAGFIGSSAGVSLSQDPFISSGGYGDSSVRQTDRDRVAGVGLFLNSIKKSAIDFVTSSGRDIMCSDLHSIEISLLEFALLVRHNLGQFALGVSTNPPFSVNYRRSIATLAQSLMQSPQNIERFAQFTRELVTLLDRCHEPTLFSLAPSSSRAQVDKLVKVTKLTPILALVMGKAFFHNQLQIEWNSLRSFSCKDMSTLLIISQLDIMGVYIPYVVAGVPKLYQSILINEVIAQSDPYGFGVQGPRRPEKGEEKDLNIEALRKDRVRIGLIDSLRLFSNGTDSFLSFYWFAQGSWHSNSLSLNYLRFLFHPLPPGRVRKLCLDPPS
jgi:hypothetical protein